MRHVLRFLGPAAMGLAILLTCATDFAFARERRRRGPRRSDRSPAVGETAPDFELVTLKWLLMSDEERAKAKAKSETEAKRKKAKGGEERTGRDETDGEKTGRKKTGRDGNAEDVKTGHVRLSSFRGKGPVVFVLTSYT